jgi:hypothetical protein
VNPQVLVQEITCYSAELHGRCSLHLDDSSLLGWGWQEHPENTWESSRKDTPFGLYAPSGAPRGQAATPFALYRAPRAAHPKGYGRTAKPRSAGRSPRRAGARQGACPNGGRDGRDGVSVVPRCRFGWNRRMPLSRKSAH